MHKTINPGPEHTFVTYTNTKRVAGEFDAVVDDVIDALGDEGFGVLCDIDVAGTFEQKLDVDDYRQYRILGACNPALAKDGLDVDLDLGALLPCNVVVYEADDGTSVVSAVAPEALLSLADTDEFDDLEAEVTERFDRVLASLAAAE